MVRLHFVVEGQTEEAFVNRVLKEHLAMADVFADARRVLTGRKHGISYKGGLIRFAQASGDIGRWMREDSGRDVRFTTMFDLYRLPADFPGYEEAGKIASPFDRADYLERELGRAVGDPRLIPYIQVHEFEALIFCEPERLRRVFPDRDREIAALIEQCGCFDTPELIDDGEDTAPSKRIERAIPEYQKVVHGVAAAEGIGLDAMRRKCKHFDRWIRRIETLASEMR